MSEFALPAAPSHASLAGNCMWVINESNHFFSQGGNAFKASWSDPVAASCASANLNESQMTTSTLTAVATLVAGQFKDGFQEPAPDNHNDSPQTGQVPVNLCSGDTVSGYAAIRWSTGKYTVFQFSLRGNTLAGNVVSGFPGADTSTPMGSNEGPFPTGDPVAGQFTFADPTYINSSGADCSPDNGTDNFALSGSLTFG